MAEIYPQPQPRSRWAPGPPDPNTMTAEERQAEVGQIIAVAMNRVSNRQDSRNLDSFGFRKPDGKN